MSSSLRTHSVSVPLVRALLDEHGYAIVERVGDTAAAEDLLADLGVLIPQYDGRLTHNVHYRLGDERGMRGPRYETIRAHTAAPGWSPSPSWVALLCHHQAECGGGHTDLLDIQHVRPRLTAAERAVLRTPTWFPAPNSSGGRGVHAPLLDEVRGRDVLRFDHDLLTTGTYAPQAGPAARPDGDRLLPLGAPGAALAEKISGLFEQLRSRILVPEGALLIWDNERMLHVRASYLDVSRHLTRFWIRRAG